MCGSRRVYVYCRRKTITRNTKEVVFTSRKGNRQPKFAWVVSNMIKVQHEFPKNCQFVFTKNRTHSTEIIPKLLKLVLTYGMWIYNIL